MESGQNNKKALIYRARLMGLCLIIFAVAVFVKLLKIQYYDTYRGKTWAEYSVKNDLKLDTIPAMRGNIYSSDNSLLATSLPFYYIGLDTKVADSAYFEANLEELANLLNKSFGEKSVEDYKARIRKFRNSKSARYLRLKSKVITHLEREKIKEWPFFRRDKKGGGGKFETIYKRYKPFSPMADRTIGGIDPKTGKGYIGIEASFDKYLEGKSGVGWVERVEGGLKIPVGDAFNIRPESGKDIYTTLDMNYQDMAEHALRKRLVETNANFGCVIVMEVATGAIKAMANLTRRGEGNYEEDFNYALAGSNDPGSTFKLPTMMAILEETKINPDNVFVETGNGSYQFKGTTVSDSKRGGYGNISATEVFEKSSNIGILRLMQKYFFSKPDVYLNYLKQFHLTQPTGIHMKGEKPPFIKDRQHKQWSGYSLFFMSHGYEMSMTPLQTLTFYNAVANDGYWVRPMLVREIRNAEIIEDKVPSYIAEKPICSIETIRKLKKMMEGVVEHGTATNVKSNLFKIAGKTGTAQKLIDGQYKRGQYYTSFAGYFPADKPKYSCIVIVDTPRGDVAEYQLFAGTVAAPVFKEVADRIYAYDPTIQNPIKDTLPKTSRDLKFAGRTSDLRVISENLNLSKVTTQNEFASGSIRKKGDAVWQGQNITSKEIPDLSGLTMRDALSLMENKGFKVNFKGSGKVIEQSIPPGKNPKGIKTILLTLQ